MLEINWAKKTTFGVGQGNNITPGNIICVIRYSIGSDVQGFAIIDDIIVSGSVLVPNGPPATSEVTATNIVKMATLEMDIVPASNLEVLQ
jgi:hypothetical protein